MPSSYYQDITETAPKSMQESVKNIKKGKSKMVESLSSDKILKILKESNIDDSIVAKVITKLSEGGINVSKQRIYRVPVARINPPGTLNGNHRRYPEELWENVMNNQESAWKGLCGLADHPTDDSDPGSFKNSSIVWLGMEIDKENNLVYGIGSFVGPYGHLAQEIIDAGGRVGFSSSGFGELMADNETVNPKTYQIERLADVVLNPSQNVYGVINDETSLGNIEYSKKQAVHESMDKEMENKLQENTNMDAKESGVKSALSKVEEKELRKHINNYLKENVEITNPIKQLEDLKEIQKLIQEGQLTDLEDTVTEKLAEAQKRIEEMVEYGLKMKEAEVSIEAGAPEDTKVEVSADGAVEVTVGETPVAPVVEPEAESKVESEMTEDEADAIIDEAATAAGETPEEDLVESKLTDRESKAIREYVENFLSADHSAENPLKVIEETNEILNLVKEGKLVDMEESVTARIEDLQKQLNEDIISAHQMKLDLKASSVTEVNESAKSIMKSGKLLVEQISDYKELCEAITERNQKLFKEYNEMKAKVALYEAQLEDNDISKNQKIVSLSEKVNELEESFENLDTRAGEKVTELQESIKNYQEGNAKLEKANGLLKTQLKEAIARADVVADEVLELKESIKKLKADNAKKLNESIIASSVSKDEFDTIKAENESLKAAIASFKESQTQAPVAVTKVDMTKIDESARQEIKTLRNEIKSLRERLGENVENYVKSMENSVVSYYNDLEARYGESIKPYKASFLNARSLREAQRMFMGIYNKLDIGSQFDESHEQTVVPAEGKVSDFYQGNDLNGADAQARAFGLL